MKMSIMIINLIERRYPSMCYCLMSCDVCHVTCRAAFQYGVKMNDGRKTRRQGVKNDKAKLDREWNQISQVN